jgi:hypothetical protein
MRRQTRIQAFYAVVLEQPDRRGYRYIPASRSVGKLSVYGHMKDLSRGLTIDDCRYLLMVAPHFSRAIDSV